jgi:hypothetical protein
MSWLIVVVGAFIFVEVFLRLPVVSVFSGLSRACTRARQVLRSELISDPWKEKLLLRCAWLIGSRSLIFLGMLLAALTPLATLVVASEATGLPVREALYSPTGVVLCTVSGFLYGACRAWIPNKRSSRSGNYGLLAMLLHRMVLSSSAVANAAYDLESQLFAKHGGEHQDPNPVFVAGLARAGTTLLMRLLHQTGRFGSLTYRDMPFVLAPNLWRRLRGGFASDLSGERAHGDGLLFDIDSPESLDEVFWRVHCGEDYIFQDHLAPMTASEEVVAKFRRYVALILRSHDAERYLSKNNNNLLRLSTIRAAFPDGTILVPFRRPTDQAASLLAQHRRFSVLHRQDAFALSYMTWLVHHEFGSDHRPFAWGLAARGKYDPHEIDYWLAQWVAVYDNILLQRGLGLIFVDYDRLCAEPEAVWGNLARRLCLPEPMPMEVIVRPATLHKRPMTGDRKLIERAVELHRTLVELSRVTLDSEFRGHAGGKPLKFLAGGG